MIPKSITSIQNPFVKSLIQLQEKARLRKKTGTFIIEGEREINLALQGGYEIIDLLYCSDIIATDTALQYQAASYTSISKDVYEKIAYRTSTEGLIALTKAKNLALSDLPNVKNGLYLICDAIEKPGNLGALLRTADAAHVDGVILSNPTSDIYNPNVIRSSVGCVFTNPIAIGTTAEVVSFLKENKINAYGAALQASVPYHTQNYSQSTAILVGTEATGLTDEWLRETHQNIIIPMSGKIDSMNVSVAAAILLFEAKRQRDF